MKKDADTPKLGRPVDARKRDQILEIATELFMKKGFYDTSMDEIAKKAGMSKLTLYRRFPDKDTLFTDVIRGKCNEFIPERLFEVFDQKSPREAIYIFGHAFFTFITSDDAITLYRMMASEAEKSPSLTKLFYESGPKRVKGILGEKLKIIANKDGLHIADPEHANDALIAFFLGSDIYMRRLLNVGVKTTEKEIEAHARRASDLFITAYNKKNHQRS